ncbi:hypothetical protein IMSAGC019_01736 [Lachnospiraceae bacterium]|nr:hypothetical protein IMSAGC019_01736 [Lachnospiraceae bacterium]
MNGKRCKICRNSKNNKIYIVHERMLNNGNTFQYLFCDRCGTLQLIDEVVDIGKYYQEDYLMFKNEGCAYQKKISYRLKAWIYLNLKLSNRINNVFKFYEYRWLYPLKGMHIRKNSKILDVGCGSGRWLNQLSSLGYKNLYGVDKFSPDLTNNEWRFIRGDIDAIPEIGGYDLITLHHSFEHMDAPMYVLGVIKKQLKSDGICIIRVPVMNEAWSLYGINWYQIDAPRHFFIYSLKAMKYMCNKAGLKVCKVDFDSTAAQFYISEGYRDTEKKFAELSKYALSQHAKYQKMADELNHRGKGDQAIFYIKRK